MLDFSAPAHSFIWELIKRALDSSIASMGTTLLAVGGSLLYPLVKVIRTAFASGWTGLRNHWRDGLREAAIIAVLWWGLLFSWHLFYKVPAAIRADSLKIKLPIVIRPAPLPKFWDAKTEWPKKRHLPQPIAVTVETQAPYGNLAKRCDALGEAIIRLARERNKDRPDFATHLAEYKEWFSRNDGIFRYEFRNDVIKIQQEMSALHVDDPRLDELIKKHEDDFATRQKNVTEAGAFPQAYHLSIEDIDEIGTRFRNLAIQIPQSATEPRLSVQGQSLLAEINKLVEPYDKDISNPAFGKMDVESEETQLYHNFMDSCYDNALHFREQALRKLGRANGDSNITLIYQTLKIIDTAPNGPEPRRYHFIRPAIARICKDIQGLVDQLTAIGE